MTKRLIVLCAALAVLGASHSLYAQTATPAQSKIGVMNIQAAIANTAEGKKVLTDLQKKYQPRQEELQRLQQQIQAIQDQLTKQSATMSEEEQARLSREAEDKQKTYKRTAEDAQNDFTHDRDEAINRVGQKMLRVIADYAQQNGFLLVMDDAQVPIYFASKDIELTAEIVKRYDAANPVAAASAPATAKPAVHSAAAASTARPK